MSLHFARGLALFLATLPLSLLANCGGNGQSQPEQPGADMIIRTGIPDTGPTEDNCAMRDAFELDVHHDFERNVMDTCSTSSTNGQTIYGAPTWYIFSDGTTPFVRPGALEMRAPEVFLLDMEPTWGIDGYPAADLPGGAACDESRGVLRLWGGPFAQWGGGVGSGYFRPPRPPGSPPHPPDVKTTQLGQYDASMYEGVSFWARRGPEGQTTLRINVVDQQISEEYAKSFYFNDQEPPYCEVATRCDCVNGKPCNFYDPAAYGNTVTATNPAAYYCWDPGVDPLPDGDQLDFLGCQDVNADGVLVPRPRALGIKNAIRPKLCGDSLCASRFDPRDGPAPALPMVGQPVLLGTVTNAGGNVGGACTERIFDNGLTGNFCGNEDQHVPEPTDRCGNTYSQIVQVTEEWQLFTVPFSELLQADYAYKGERLDPTKIWGLGFGWIGGWADFYIDDVGFYRRL